MEADGSKNWYDSAGADGDREFKTLQMYSTFDEHEKGSGGLILNEAMPPWPRRELSRMRYKLSYQPRTSGPMNAIYFDWIYGSMWGGSSNHGVDDWMVIEHAKTQNQPVSFSIV